MITALCGQAGGITKSGKPCRIRVSDSGRLCMAHDPQHRKAKSEAAAKGGRVTKLDRALRIAGLDADFAEARRQFAAALRGEVTDQHARAVLNMARTMTELSDLSISILDADRDDEQHGPLQDLVFALERLRADSGAQEASVPPEGRRPRRTQSESVRAQLRTEGEDMT